MFIALKRAISFLEEIMILFVASDYIPHAGGKSSHILDLQSGLKNIGVDSLVFSKKQFSNMKLKIVIAILRPLKWINANLYTYAISLWWRSALSRKVYSLYKQYNPECISFQDAYAAAALSKYRSRIECPMVLTMHTYFGLENKLDKKNNIITNAVYNKQLNFELESLSSVNKIIAVDNRIREHVVQTIKNRTKKCNVGIENVISIENFTNIESFSPSTLDEKKKFRESMSIPTDKIVLCCIRRLVEKNGVIFAVKAMTQLNESYVLVIGGSGPQEQEIRNYISENGLSEKVIMLGSISSDTARKVYAVSDISLVPSITVNNLQEATSISAIEAMACGLPVIASSIGGLKQMIVDKENGMLVNEGDETQIANAILELNNITLYQKVAQNARKSVERQYSHIQAAKKYYSAFKTND